MTRMLEQLQRQINTLQRRLSYIEAIEHHSHPSCRVYNSANISVADSTNVTLTFNSERWDNDGIHSTTSNTSRLTCQTAGKYLIVGNLNYASNATGNRWCNILLNGATQIGTSNETALAGGHTTRVIATTIYELSIDDYIELWAYQTSGGALNVTATSNYSPTFSMIWLGN